MPEAISNNTVSTRWIVYGLVIAPDQKHMTDDAVYTALLWLITVYLFVYQDEMDARLKWLERDAVKEDFDETY